MIWALFAILTAVVIAAVAHPLLRSDAAAASGPSEADFYRRQLAEIERDHARGLLTDADAESARVEAARRLIQVGGDVPAKTDAAARPRFVAAGLLVVLIPLLAGVTYLRLGQPDRPDLPLSARVSDGQDIEALVAKVEKRLREQPDDIRGYDALGPVYLRLGRMQDAERVFGDAIRIGGENATRLVGLADARVVLANGVITAQAREALDKAAALDPNHPRALFMLGVAAEQDGAADKAKTLYERILSNSPPNAPWIAPVRERLAALAPSQGGAVAAGSAPPEAAPDAVAASGVPTGPAAEAIAALPPEQRQAQIRAMVDGLAERLSHNGQDVQGWVRLIRAWVVLGDKDKARAAVSDARKALTADAAATAQIDGLARELGLEG